MDAFIIEGQAPLKGTVRISGSKNAALPLLMSSILFDSPLEFNNIPNLRDINTTIKLLETLGCKTHFEQNTVKIEPETIKPEAPYELVKTMRASVLCLGPLLARLGEASVAMPGGCAIGARPVDLHLSALEKMGAEFTLEDGNILGRCKKLQGAHIHFDFPTVGGTENILMAACLAEGETILDNVAREPEIVDLARFLKLCGAKIEGEGSSRITIQGVTSLAPKPYSVMPDRIEAGTFLIAAPMTQGELYLENCPLEDMQSLCAKLSEAGVLIEEVDGKVRVCRKGEHIHAVNINTAPHPNFPTDMQAQFMSMLTIAQGHNAQDYTQGQGVQSIQSTVEENIFENRFMHVSELVRMGADIRLSGSVAVIGGVPALNAAPVMASDLRASASLVLAALSASGISKIQRIYHLDRGYERMEEKLLKLGARIRRVNYTE